MSQPTNTLMTEDPPTRVSPWVMVAVGASSVLSSLDLFIVNLAFPAIRDSFPGATNQIMSWVLTAYTIAFAAFLVPSGRLADLYGRKRVFIAGLLVFAVASAACAFAPNVVSLILARGLKGLGAALMIPTSLGLLLATYPKTRHKQMVGIWAAAGSVAAALSPTLGGVLVEIDWRLIFLINLPVVMVALWLSKHLIESSATDGVFPDIAGSVLLIAGIGCLVTGISYTSVWGVESISLWLAFGAATLFLVLFVWRCLTVLSPALDLRVFQAPAFSFATFGMACFYMGFAIMLLGGSLYLTQVWRWEPMIAGAGIGISPGAAVLASLLVGKINISPKRLTALAGFLFLIAGIWWYAMLGSEPDYLVSYLPGLLLAGAGAGIGQTGFLAGGTAALPEKQYATGTGIINTARQIGAVVGVSVFVAVSGTALYADQYSLAWLLMAGFGATVSISALLLRD
ncbi:MFS transporter [Pectobacterium atrosepticum]|uniref:MFS transporter n=1 Tax=Pectobacterium atrosepticum TaxID=29471 RepID=UPI0003A72D55|nr:MFS transporter [Pectobacterium atrosepticum]ATY91238.1 MFS transporter [Pectobacterium atrosepticum]MBL0893962.1 MFS transporter [Pectobacterium atrosepticum]MCA6977797.1 MFS transporter [Pectobacterium atrosepticum]MCH5018996.1 MFS transporter [Pectobacterium atrosepticum]PWD65137.1 MFS transporter [Pectobacterium atrosepticum]